MNLNNIKTSNLEYLVWDTLSIRNISGKNDGIGGTEALDTSKMEIQIDTQCNLDSEPVNTPKRELAVALNVPADKKSPIDAQP